jgi:hypothetical protein
MAGDGNTWTIKLTEYMRLRLELAAKMMVAMFGIEDWDDRPHTMAARAVDCADELLKQSGARIDEDVEDVDKGGATYVEYQPMHNGDSRA